MCTRAHREYIFLVYAATLGDGSEVNSFSEPVLPPVVLGTAGPTRHRRSYSVPPVVFSKFGNTQHLRPFLFRHLLRPVPPADFSALQKRSSHKFCTKPYGKRYKICPKLPYDGMPLARVCVRVCVRV